jgi:uncharacterized protein YdaU (DUF1376 family)
VSRSHVDDFKVPQANRRIRAERMAAARKLGRHTTGQWNALRAFCQFKCVRCGRKGHQDRDHIKPVYQGGSDGIENIQPLCACCNSSKGFEALDYRPRGWREAVFVNFYKHHIGDYSSATDHLSWDEDMAYTRLMRLYYRDEKPLPSEMRQIYRIARAQSKVQRAAVDAVLAEFFDKQADGWHNKRCDEEISIDRAFIEKQRANGLASAAKRAPHINGGSTTVATVAQPKLNGGSTVGQPPTPTPTPTPKSLTPLPPLEKGAARQRRSPERAERDRALKAWAVVVATHGAVDDPKARQAMQTIGGYSRIRLRTTQEESRIRQEFVDAYRNAGP